MSLREEHIAKIEKYLDGVMSASERQDFELLVEQNPDLAEALQVHRAMVRAIQEKERAELKHELKASWQDYRSDRKPNSFVLTRVNRLRIVAAIMVILSAVFVYRFNPFQGPPVDSLFDEYFEVFSPPQVRNDEETLNQALKLYNSGEYNASIPLFRDIILKEDTDQYRLYLASSYLSLGQAEKALESLAPLANLPTGSLQSHGRWYTVLTHLKLNQVGECKSLLKKIITAHDDYEAEARELLKKLDN